jgi:hypothetical protein
MGYESRNDEDSLRGLGYFRLTKKMGALIGAGAGYLTGLGIGSLKEIIIDKLPYLVSGQNVKEILLNSFSVGSKYAAEFAIAGTVLGILFAKLYGRRYENEYVEEE